MFDTLLAKVFTIFAQVMVKIQPIWDKYKLLISLALGVAIGMLLAYGIFPVQYENANPGNMRADFRSIYLAGVAEDYARTNDIRAVREKLGMGMEMPKTRTIPWRNDPDVLQKDLDTAVQYAEAGKYNLGEKLTALKRLQQDLPAMISAWQTEEAAATAAAGGLLNTIIRVLAALLVATLIAAALWFFFVGRKKQAVQPASTSSLPATVAVTPTGEIIGEEIEPSSVKTYTYVLGDDYFDPSFSIEIGADFFGECGIGISETLGAGDPKKVTAFETWLFDKSDIRTVTTVLASQYALEDPGLIEKIQPKREGDDLQEIRPGMEVTLDTTALRVKARVTELEYAQGNFPPNSFFQKVTFELRAWVKQVAA
ncbi:MAG TPA: hypothetical protein PLH19_00770 [Anaerolineae bacterium]|nr:hypothetical protein [Anaerolineae bacterium]HQH37052.1 hypothetical protein [Anaerolineae bacterium]